MHESLDQLGEYLVKRLSHYPLHYTVGRGELELTTDSQSLHNVLSFLQIDTHSACEQLMDLCAIPFERGYALVYNVLSLDHNHRIRLVAEASNIMPSVSNIYKNAAWFEREIWDMYGILFSGHEDLRRVLLGADFEGHPLRKDFAFSGAPKEEQTKNKKNTKEGLET
jgi:NADH:ubiquinone oxidoreductase subunit C